MIAAGFLLIRPVPRPSYVSPELMPVTVISASRCICPAFPDPDAISWVATEPEHRKAGLLEAGVPASKHAEAIEWATETFGQEYGWPRVFYSLEAALAAKQRFFPPDDPIRAIGLGLPDEYAERFIAATTQPQSPPGYAPNGESGYLEMVKRRAPLPDGGQPLGFELLNVFLGMIEDSWLCNSLDSHMAETLGIRPSATGLIASLEDAQQVCEEINAERVGAEPGPWFPMQLVEYF